MKIFNRKQKEVKEPEVKKNIIYKEILVKDGIEKKDDKTFYNKIVEVIGLTCDCIISEPTQIYHKKTILFETLEGEIKPRHFFYSDFSDFVFEYKDDDKIYYSKDNTGEIK